MFKKGDKVLCTVADSIGITSINCSSFLSEGALYEVLGVDLGRGGEVMVKLIGDDNYQHTVYAARFELAEEDTSPKYSAVIRKIKQMESMRKELGYRW